MPSTHAWGPWGEPGRPLRGFSDDEIKAPLWMWPAELARAVIHERRRRFGWDDDAEERANG